MILTSCNPFDIQPRLIFNRTGWAYDGHVPSWVQVDLNSTATVSQVNVLNSCIDFFVIAEVKVVISSRKLQFLMFAGCDRLKNKLRSQSPDQVED